MTAGRPTREQAAARHAALLEHALEHFLERGYEQATIEAIAAAVSMTKRTVYARYPDKAALFLAAVRRGVEGVAVTDARIAAALDPDLARTLTNIARLRIDVVGTPRGLRLQRIINAESYRFPALIGIYYARATEPTVLALAAVLRRATAAGALALDDPVLAANVFLGMAVSGPVRFILSGNALAPEALEARIAFAVRLFLDGARRR